MLVRGELIRLVKFAGFRIQVSDTVVTDITLSYKLTSACITKYTNDIEILKMS